MRIALLILLSMFASAVFIWLGGNLMARNETKEITPVDRERFALIASKLSDETQRLEKLYLSHLKRISEELNYQSIKQVISSASTLRAVDSIAISNELDLDRITQFSDNGSVKLKLINKEKLSQNNQEGVFLAFPKMKSERLLKTNDPNFSLFVQVPKDGTCIAFLIDNQMLYEISSNHVLEEIRPDFKAFIDHAEHVRLDDLNDNVLLSSGDNFSTLENLFHPINTSIGSWKLLGWDREVTTYTYDQPTVILSRTLSVILALVGILLYRQQKHSTQRAAERVSFVNNVSHELSTPLTNIALNLSLIMDSQSSNTRLSLVNEEVERLSRLVKNVLTFARVDRSKLDLKPTECLPNELIAKTLESFRPALERKGIVSEVDLQSPQAMKLDPDAFCQIIANLISNVEKHAHAGKSLKIRSCREENTLYVQVSDQGEGIPKKLRKHIFGAFKRVANKTTTGASGTGLGLNISRALALSMGGTLEYKDNTEIENSGSCFLLILPATS